MCHLKKRNSENYRQDVFTKKFYETFIKVNNTNTTNKTKQNKTLF